jgi:photosystem I P700 chlorophyll a apoprotein A1
MYFHGARFSNYEAWLTDPTHIKPSAQICCSRPRNFKRRRRWWFPRYSNYFRFLPIMAWFRNHKRIIHYSHWWFNFSWCDVLCGLVPLPQSSSKLEWFQNVESMLNHHLAGLLGLGSLGWAGHQFTFRYLLTNY